MDVIIINFRMQNNKDASCKKQCKETLNIQDITIMLKLDVKTAKNKTCSKRTHNSLVCGLLLWNFFKDDIKYSLNAV